MSKSDLEAIYRQLVLDHSRHPHNFGCPGHFDREARGFNRLCGDKVTVFIKLDGDRIATANFEGTGCAISIASASMMTDAVTGESIDEALALSCEVRDMFEKAMPLADEKMKDFIALEGVRRYPSRIKCAMLAWSTLEAALANNTKETISTE
jgi:nitrogen fixation NifU-like protein